MRVVRAVRKEESARKDSVARAAVEEGGEGVDEGVGEGVGEGDGEGDGEGSSEGGDDAVAVRVDNQACKHRRRRYRRSATSQAWHHGHAHARAERKRGIIRWGKCAPLRLSLVSSFGSGSP